MSNTEETKLAPTASIETVMIIRPLKVLAVVFGFMSLVLMILYVGASAWVSVDDVRFGLWQTCVETRPDYVSCSMSDEKTWLLACRGLCLLCAIFCIAANLVVCRGLQGEKFTKRYRCYYIGMLLYFLAALFNVTALIIYPIKYSEEMGRKQSGATWSFGWAYGVGWGATVLLVTSALMICLDKDAEEIVFRERSSSSCEENGIEEEVVI